MNGVAQSDEEAYQGQCRGLPTKQGIWVEQVSPIALIQIGVNCSGGVYFFR